jgi:hypothetical protein
MTEYTNSPTVPIEVWVVIICERTPRTLTFASEAAARAAASTYRKAIVERKLIAVRVDRLEAQIAEAVQ